MEHLYYWFKHVLYSYDLSKAFGTFTLNQIMANFDGKIKNINGDNKIVLVSSFEGDIISINNNLNISSAACI